MQHASGHCGQLHLARVLCARLLYGAVLDVHLLQDCCRPCTGSGASRRGDRRCAADLRFTEARARCRADRLQLQAAAACSHAASEQQPHPVATRQQQASQQPHAAAAAALRAVFQQAWAVVVRTAQLLHSTVRLLQDTG